ncbi:hypothetical protein IQ07DRAFT_418955 [Pyrenochaeta sp. DS3sAY3a]|nr:hypothetical protein IQ07DRAFT_418955 [Pyrenochaeta sp. DS3sAY3a]
MRFQIGNRRIYIPKLDVSTINLQGTEFSSGGMCRERRISCSRRVPDCFILRCHARTGEYSVYGSTRNLRPQSLEKFSPSSSFLSNKRISHTHLARPLAPSQPALPLSKDECLPTRGIRFTSDLCLRSRIFAQALLWVASRKKDCEVAVPRA